MACASVILATREQHAATNSVVLDARFMGDVSMTACANVILVTLDQHADSFFVKIIV